jgi:putative polysaccharide biosynthesis protein
MRRVTNVIPKVIKRLIKKRLTTVIGALSDYQYHQFHKRKAGQILYHIENAKGKAGRVLLNKCNDYACDVFGSRRYAPWLYVYSVVAGVFKEGWIPDNYYGKVVMPVINGYFGDVSEVRTLSRRLFSSDVFPDTAYLENGIFFDTKLEVIKERDLSTILFGRSHQAVFKASKSFQGHGVRILDKRTFDANEIRRLGNGVFQDYIEQHEMFEKFVASVATIRVTTAIDDIGRCSVRACSLRLGRAADPHVKSSSHVRIPVSQESGELAEQGYLATWVAVDRHPDSRCRFAGRRIPAFNKCISTVLDLHRRMPFARCIGWDVTVDKNDGVKVMEWNANHNGITFAEATQGPCFADFKWEKLWRSSSVE